MSNAELYYDKRYRKKRGFPLKIRIWHKGQTSYIHLFDIDPLYWNAQTNMVKKKCPGFDNIKRLNNEIIGKVSLANTTINKLYDSGKLRSYSIQKLKDEICKSFTNNTSNNEITFFKYFDSFIEKKGTINKRTQEIYESTRNKLLHFHGDGELFFSDISYSFLEKFDLYMISESRKMNTRSFHFRNIRAVFNDAIDNEIIGLSSYPFRKFKIKNEKTAKRNLTPDAIKSLMKVETKTQNEKIAKDVFFIIFYLIGINIKDLLHLKEIKHGRIQYKRFKGGKNYNLKVEPEALQLLSQYPGQNFLLYFNEHYSTYKQFTKEINKNLKKLALRIGIEADLTTYYARHSWATIARNIGISRDDIRSALGHGENTVTDIYIDLDQEIIDKANRKVIDYILK